MSSDSEEEYEIERILEQRGSKYLVKWKGFEEEADNTWEPLSALKKTEALATWKAKEAKGEGGSGPRDDCCSM